MQTQNTNTSILPRCERERLYSHYLDFDTHIYQYAFFPHILSSHPDMEFGFFLFTVYNFYDNKNTSRIIEI